MIFINISLKLLLISLEKSVLLTSFQNNPVFKADYKKKLERSLFTKWTNKHRQRVAVLIVMLFLCSRIALGNKGTYSSTGTCSSTPIHFLLTCVWNEKDVELNFEISSNSKCILILDFFWLTCIVRSKINTRSQFINVYFPIFQISMYLTF